MIILSTCSALNRIETAGAQEEGNSHSLWCPVQASYEKGMFELGGVGIGRYGDPPEAGRAGPRPRARVEKGEEAGVARVWKRGGEQGKHAAHEAGASLVSVSHLFCPGSHEEENIPFCLPLGDPD